MTMSDPICFLSRKFFWLVPVVLIGAIPVSAQQEQSKSAPQIDALPSPESIRPMLLDNSQNEKRNDLAAKLDLRKDFDGSVCDSFDTVKIEHPLLERGRSYAVLIIRSDIWWTEFVTVLEQKAGKWQLLKTISLFSKYELPNITFPALIESGVQEIEIDADALFAGTGRWQYNVVIYKLYGGMPTVIFDEPKIVNWSNPVPIDAQFENGNQYRETSFVFVPADSSEKSRVSIAGKEVLKQGRNEIVTYSRYIWYPSMRRFRPTVIDQGTFEQIVAKNKKRDLSMARHSSTRCSPQKV